jgi:hypothetical protein
MIEVKDLVKTNAACPATWEFKTFEDRLGFVHYRYGRLTIQIGYPGEGVFDLSAFESIEVIGDDLDGVISWTDVKKRLDDLMEHDVITGSWIQ